MAEYRTGQGFDVHRLGIGRRLMLGGIEVPFGDKGLLGHSDGDVALHALIDAILGAAALGDIGVYFPDTDRKYLGVSSVKLLAETGEMLNEAGFCLSNADITIITEGPRISPYYVAMREKIGETLGVSKEAISVKATTTERLGFTGRGEGIAAMANVLVTKLSRLTEAPIE